MWWYPGYGSYLRNATNVHLGMASPTTWLPSTGVYIALPSLFQEDNYSEGKNEGQGCEWDSLDQTCTTPSCHLVGCSLWGTSTG